MRGAERFRSRVGPRWGHRRRTLRLKVATADHGAPRRLPLACREPGAGRGAVSLRSISARGTHVGRPATGRRDHLPLPSAFGAFVRARESRSCPVRFCVPWHIVGA